MTNTQRAENLHTQIPAEGAGILEQLKSIANVSEVIRIFGACAVIASMSLFLLEGWSNGNDIQRYLKLLGQTGLLTLAGLVLSLVVKEYKGARLFFGLGLISVVANFAILGALFYSLFPVDATIADYPEMVTWVAIKAEVFWPVFAGALVALALVTRFCYSIFARNIANALTISFLLLNGLLLVPLRGSLSVSVLLLAGTLAAFYVIKALRKRDETVITAESKFAFVTLCLPLLVMAVRSLSLYQVDEIMMITINSLIYLGIRSAVARIQQTTNLKDGLEICQFCIGVLISLQVSALVPDSLCEFSPAILSALVIAFAVDQMIQSDSRKWRTSILSISSIGLVTINVMIGLFESALAYKISSLVVCMALIGFVTAAQPYVNTIIASRRAAMLGAVISLGLISMEFIAMIDLSSWMVLGLIGILSIFAASFYERFGIRFSQTAKS
ncbi:MAG: hypothetical protein AAF431_06725 [Pseudomonadota bacterium]